MNNTVDTRHLKSGKIRLRFKLNDYGIKIIERAIKISECTYTNTSIEIISASYLSGPFLTTSISARGKNRFLVSLFPEQYELVRAALDTAKTPKNFDEDALCHMCNLFITTENQ